MNNNKISIITPSYNSKSTIDRSYRSVLSQTFSDWEWIIVDDFSTDGSFDFIKELAGSDSRIKVFKTDSNIGTGATRNIGLKHATGKYVTFLDSDDQIDANYLEEQLAFIKENGPIVSSGYRRKTENSCTDFYVPDEVDYKKALGGNPLSCLSTMYDRETIEDIYFPEDIDRPEDYVFWLRILKKGYIARGNHKVLATYNIHPGSRSYNKLKLIKCQYVVYHKFEGFNWFKSWFYVLKWARYGKKKYKNVR